MKHRIFSILLFALFILASCNKESEFIDDANIDLSSRSFNNLNLTIKLTDQSIISISGSSFAVSPMNDSHFTILVNNSISYTASEVSVTEENSTFKLIKNPGLNKSVFNNINEATISLNNSGQISFTFGNGSHIANAIIGDENDSL